MKVKITFNNGTEKVFERLNNTDFDEYAKIMAKSGVEALYFKNAWVYTKDILCVEKVDEQ